MSNSRRLRGSRSALPRCGHCGGPVRKGTDSVTLPDRRVICTRCVGTNVLFQRLPCGHMGVPGMQVFSDSADQSNFRCSRCTAPESLAAAR